MNIIRVVDFETTGLEPPAAEVCEVGYCDIDIDAGTIALPMSWLCKVQDMPPEARAVHHISFADCENKDRFDPVSLYHNVVACYASHNASFETKFWTPDKPIICTYKAALRVWPNAPGHSNQILRYWLSDQGKMPSEFDGYYVAHRAACDVYVTAHILLALLATGVTGREMVAWTKEPAVMPTCPIGKYRGKPWAEVDGGFLSWMTSQPDMEYDLVWNAQREMTRRQGAR